MACNTCYPNPSRCAPRVPSTPRGCGPANNCCTELPAPPCDTTSRVVLVWDGSVGAYVCAPESLVNTCTDVTACLAASATGDWVPITLSAGWVALGAVFNVRSEWGYNPTALRRIALQINATKSVAAAGSLQIGTLGAAYRPSIDVSIPIVVLNGVTSIPGFVRIDAATGNVFVSDIGGATTWDAAWNVDISFAL